MAFPVLSGLIVPDPQRWRRRIAIFRKLDRRRTERRTDDRFTIALSHSGCARIFADITPQELADLLELGWTLDA